MSDKKGHIEGGYQPKKKRGWQPQPPKGDGENPDPDGGYQPTSSKGDNHGNPPKEE